MSDLVLFFGKGDLYFIAKGFSSNFYHCLIDLHHSWVYSLRRQFEWPYTS